jgi:hypothetical protein
VRIVRMYSGTIADSSDWKKVEVEVDENDLESILYEAGVFNPYFDREKIKTKYAFQLLTFEAEILLNTTMVQSFEVDVASTKAKIEELKSRKFSVLEQVRADVARVSDEKS